MRAGLVHEAPIPLRNLEGIPAAAAINILRPEAANPNAGDDPRVAVAPAQPQETALEKRRRLQRAFRANLRDKATSMFMTKDFDSPADKKVIMQSLVQLSRKEKAYEFYDNPSNTIAEVYAESMREAIGLRYRAAKDTLSAENKPVIYRDMLTSVKAGISGAIDNTKVKTEARKVKGDVPKLKALENTTPFSEYRISHVAWCYRPAQLIRLLFSLFFEKIIISLALKLGRDLIAVPFCSNYSWFKDDGELIENPWLIQSRFRDCSVPYITFAAVAITMAICIYELYYAYRYGNLKRCDFFNDCCTRIFFHVFDCFASFVLFFEEYAPQGSVLYMYFTYINYAIMAYHFCHNAYWIFVGCDGTRCYDILRAIQITHSVCLDNEEGAPQSKPVQSNYHSTILDYECRPTIGTRMFFGVKGIVPTVFSGCSHNEKISMEGRVGKKLPSHESLEMESKVLRAWKNLIRSVDILFDLIPRAEEPMDFDEWAHTFTPNRRRDLLRTKTNTNDMPEMVAKSFVKKEVAPKAEEDYSFKDPRFIQGCPLELSAKVGPHLRPWTKQIVASLGAETFNTADVLRGKQIYYTCGRSNEEIGLIFRNAIDLVERVAPAGSEIVFLEDDQSRFDLHMGEGPFRFLKTMYRRKLPRKVARLLERKVSVGVSSLGTRYKVPFTMQSGWPDTSVGDTLVNAAMKIWIHGSGRPWVTIICGDDSVTVTTRDEIIRLGGVDGIIRRYADLGMEVEASVRNDPLDVEFCSGRFYPVGDTYVLFPRPGRLISKIGCDMVDRNADDRAAWARGITATLEFYGKIDPLCRAIAVSCRRQLGSGRELYDKEWDGKSHSKYELVTTEHDHLTYYDHHYGINQKQLADLIVTCSKIKFGSLVDNEQLREVCLHDL